MNVKEIATLMKEQNDDLEFVPRDWGIFARITKMFNDEIIEDAVDMLPTKGDKENVGPYFMSLCKKASEKRMTGDNIPTILGDV